MLVLEKRIPLSLPFPEWSWWVSLKTAAQRLPPRSTLTSSLTASHRTVLDSLGWKFDGTTTLSGFRTSRGARRARHTFSFSNLSREAGVSAHVVLSIPFWFCSKFIDVLRMKCLKLHSIVLSDGQYYELVRSNFERADRMSVVRWVRREFTPDRCAPNDASNYDHAS